MPIESATYATQLSTTSPASSDPRSEGDDHLRLIKTVLAAEVNTANKGWAYTGLSAVWQTSTRIRIDSDQSSVFEVGRRVKAAGNLSGTIFGQVTSATYSASTSVNLRWDESALSDEALQLWVGAADNTLPALDELSASLSAVIAQADALSASLAHNMAYGALYLSGSTTEFSSTTSATLFTGWDVPGISNLTTLSTASGHVAVTNAGHYQVACAMDLSASSAVAITASLYVGDTAQGITSKALVNDQAHVGMHGIVSAGASDEIKVRLEGSITTSVVVTDASLTVRRLD